jgi:Kef-type K+ transport system membrane component KefB
MNIPIADVLGEVALVLAVSALFGAGARRLGQPAVIGQILAGIALGPTLLGRLPGHLESRLFPHAALGYLDVLAQVAVVIFTFTVGYELRWPARDRHGRAPLLVAASALLVPMALGAGIALTYRPGFEAAGQTHITRPFVLFIAVALSITALPVLAAILRERGIAGTVPGAIAESAAGMMDVATWLVLALALTSTAHRLDRPWSETVGLFAAFLAFMLLAVRPALRWWAGRRALTFNFLPLALVIAFGSAWVTTSLGVQAVFGGFIAGLVMPRVDGVPDAGVLSTAQDLGGQLLPVFFVVTGLSTNVSDLGGSAFVLLAVLCVLGVVGKIGPGYAASRLSGLTRQESSAVAVLVNARGLTELIALNAALQAGLIGQRLFSILVVMALLLTIATTSLLRFIKIPAETGAPGAPAARGARPAPQPAASSRAQ